MKKLKEQIKFRECLQPFHSDSLASSFLCQSINIKVYRCGLLFYMVVKLELHIKGGTQAEVVQEQGA